MFDTLFEFLARILAFFYSVVPNYALAIALMTLLVMIVTTPLTLKGTKSMIKMQQLQPELKKIQEKHKGGDRNELNQEMMAFYQENELNPLGGCFPLLVQAPVFFLLFRLIQGLTRLGEDGTFDPKFVDQGSDLYVALQGHTKMVSFGLDLSKSTTDAVGESIVTGLPYVFLILVMIGAQYYQQKQTQARNPDGASAALPQQQMLLRIMPAFFGVISIGFPAALVVYWVTSSVYRIGLQAYITKSLYRGDDSPGAKAHRASAQARAENPKTKGSTKPEPSSGDKKPGSKTPDETKPGDKTPASPSNNGKGRGTPTSGRVTPANSGGKYQPSSKKKKRKRR